MDLYIYFAYENVAEFYSNYVCINYAMLCSSDQIIQAETHNILKLSLSPSLHRNNTQKINNLNKPVSIFRKMSSFIDITIVLLGLLKKYINFFEFNYFYFNAYMYLMKFIFNLVFRNYLKFMYHSCMYGQKWNTES